MNLRLLTQNVLAACALLTGSSRALRAEDAGELLAKVGETYRNLKSYQFEGTTLSESKTKSADSKSETEFVVAYAEPNRFRVEVRYPQAGNWVRVSDGKTFSRFRSSTKEFRQEATDPADVRLVKGTIIGTLEHIDRGATNAKLVGSEKVTLDGHDVDCHVVEFQPSGQSLLPGMQILPSRVWVDKERFLVLRHVTGTRAGGNSEQSTTNTMTTTFTVAKINEPVTDSMFAVERAKAH